MVPVRDVLLRGDTRAFRRPLTTPNSVVPYRIVVVGDPAQAASFVADLNTENGPPARRLAATVPCASVGDLEHIIASARPHGVVMLNPERSDDLAAVADVCRRRRLPLQLCASDLGDDDIAVLRTDDSAFLAVQPTVSRPNTYRLKRLLDVVMAAALLCVLSPFFAVIAVLTKIGSPGPVFYVSWRVGAGEVTFPCYKFRTMVVDADVRQEELESRNEADGCLFKIKDDPRITRTGRFLRRTSLDELPQLINVLRGEMSLVGPRPLPLRDVARMEPQHRRRHAVLPGLTGLWQVTGRSTLTAADMMRLDLEYIRTWSLRLDLRILWRTVGVVFRGRGAY